MTCVVLGFGVSLERSVSSYVADFSPTNNDLIISDRRAGMNVHNRNTVLKCLNMPYCCDNEHGSTVIFSHILCRYLRKIM